MTLLFNFSDFKEITSSIFLKYFSPFFLKISEMVYFSISSILLSVSINSNSSFFDNILPIEDFPDPIMPTKTKFLFNFMSFYIEITQICRIFEIT